MSLKEENLLPYEGIVKSGQRLVKVGNTFMPIGIGGALESAGIKVKEVGYDVFYKCNAVAETTWNGYALILGEDGFYTVSETLTEGLTFGTGYTPEVGTVYNANATIKVGKYWDGVLGYSYIKFTSNNLVTEGDALQVTDGSNYNFETIDGHKCVNMNGLVASYGLTDYTTEGATFSIWGKKNDNYINNVSNAHFLSHFGSDSGSIMMNNSGIWRSKLNEQWFDITSSWEWQHWVCRFKNNTLEIFHNGNNKNRSQTFSFRVIDTIGIGDWYGNPGERTCYGYAADLRMFNRALSDNEIKALYNNGIQE